MPRRVWGFGLVVLVGFLLVFLGALLRFYVTPRVEKAPTDVYERKVAVGSGQYFIIREARLSSPTELQNLAIYRGDPERSTDEVAVISHFSRTVDLATEQDVDFSLETYAMNRDTGEAVDCCGAQPPKEGHTLKLPFGLEQRAYPLFNDTARAAFPAEFEAEEEIEGLLTYRFVSEVPATITEQTEVPGFIVGQDDVEIVAVDRFYEATTTIWVEPTTGAVVKRAQTSHQWFEDALGSVTDLAFVDVADNAETVQGVAEDVSSQVSQLKLVSFWAPIVAPLLGIVLIVVGFLLLGREPSRPAEAEAEADAE